MELWIRSQDRGTLVKAEIIDVFEGGNKSKNHFFIRVLGDYVGEYETEERALEVLDEIQSNIKQTFLCKPEILKTTKDLNAEEFVLEQKYNKEFIYEPIGTKIIPLNTDVIIYEMPKE